MVILRSPERTTSDLSLGTTVMPVMKSSRSANFFDGQKTPTTASAGEQA